MEVENSYVNEHIGLRLKDGASRMQPMSSSRKAAVVISKRR